MPLVLSYSWLGIFLAEGRDEDVQVPRQSGVAGRETSHEQETESSKRPLPRPVETKWTKCLAAFEWAMAVGATRRREDQDANAVEEISRSRNVGGARRRRGGRAAVVSESSTLALARLDVTGT